ncbi:MAG: hypothetical protein ACP6IY_03960 [Promethearchaeia archaeon]
MEFLLRSEVEARDLKKLYLKKRIFCPKCKKTQVKKVYENPLYNKYICWNKNCPNKNNEFAVINDYIENEKKLKSNRCECGGLIIKDFNEIGNGNPKIRFKCTNEDCFKYNFEYVYDLAEKKWYKEEILEMSKSQYIHWYLFRRPAQYEFKLIDDYLTEQNFKLVKEDDEKDILDYRKFLKDGSCIHIKLSIKRWGFGIHGHKDIEIHSKVKFDNQTLIELSKLYLLLKKEKYGKCFLLPREIIKYKRFLKYKIKD